MTAVGVQPVSLPSGHFIMDDKKRPASYDQDEAAPPLKRQATTTATNGPTKTHQDLDIPGRDDLEVRSPNVTYTAPFFPTFMYSTL